MCVRFLVSLQWHNVHTKFHPNPSIGSRVESYGQTDGHDQPFMRSFHAHRAKNAQELQKGKKITQFHCTRS
jgi:hypothetical protein